MNPTLVRHDEAAVRPRTSKLRTARILLVLLGLASLGYYGYTLGSQSLYEGYQNWAFDHEIAGGGPTHFIDYLRQQTPVGWVLGRGQLMPYAPLARASSEAFVPRAQPGAVLGRVNVPRLHLEAIVREGVSSSILSNAVGHVPTTALAGQAGNFAIAAHRDTLFRALKNVRKGDVVTFEEPGGTYTYQIFSMRVVLPTEVSVLRPDGALPASTLQNVGYQPGASKLITLITCYPFYYVGSAPERFIVQGRLVSETSRAGPPRQKPPLRATRLRQTTSPHRASLEKPRSPQRGFSHFHASGTAVRTSTPVKKPGFWHRLFHRSPQQPA